jgi:thiol-disulfide isomerase/thioredoxin
MRPIALLAALFAVGNAGAQTPASMLWNELKTKRDALPSLHQEFDVKQAFNTAGGSRSLQRQIVLDMSQRLWRERSVTGSGNHIKIFDGQDILWMEENGDEFVRTKHRSKDADPVPSPYDLGKPDWSKAVEIGRRPCGLSPRDRLCVVLDVPLKHWVRATSGSDVARLSDGVARISLDTETGALLALRTMQVVENQRGTYQSDISYALKRVLHGAPADPNLFKLPSGDMREVKELSSWNASRIRKQLAGKPAPQWAAKDIEGNPLTLSASKGKTVLLDFFTTWCPPCRADGPSLDKLYKKYGERDLMIIGVSVSEERALVEKFLKAFPHRYPIVLTTENEMPRPYQIAVFPTYIVIDRDGNVASAVQGDQGFGELRKLLKKAGLELD